MGLFSGHHKTVKGYDLVPLKDSIELQDDLWKNSKLRMNKAFMDGGINGYNQLSHSMYKRIRKKYSTSYLKTAGVVTNNTFRMLEFDKDTLQEHLIIATGDPTAVLTNYQVNEATSVDNNLQYVLGGLIKVKCSLTDSEEDNTYYNFVITSGDVSITPTIQTSTTRTMIVIDALDDIIEVPLPIQYEKLEPINVIGVMYPIDTFNYMKNNQSDIWEWLGDPKHLAGTIDYDRLRTNYNVTTDAISEITVTDISTDTTTPSGLAGNIPTDFTVTVTLKGKARGLEDQITTVTEEVDSSILPENTTNSNTETSIEEDYYNITNAVNETNTTTIGEITSTYVVVGDRKTYITTIIKNTYLPSTRKNNAGNVIRTYIHTTTTTIVTKYEPIDYIMTVDIVQSSINCYPKAGYSIKPVIVTDIYAGYLALDTDVISVKNFINNYYFHASSSHIFDYEAENVITVLGGIATDINKVEQILIPGNAEVGKIDGPLVTHYAFKHTRDFFNKTPQEALALDVITLTGNNPSGDYIKVAIEVSSDMYSTSENHLLTPVIPLRYSNSILYTKSKNSHAQKYAIDTLKRLINIISHYPSHWKEENEDITRVSDYLGNIEEDKNTLQSIIENVSGTVHDVYNTLHDKEEELKAITNNLTSQSPPDIDDVLSKLSNPNNFEDVDEKTKKLQRVLKPMGIPKEGLNDLIDTVSTNKHIYTAVIMSGLRIFNEDNTLIVDPTNVRAKVLHLFADLMTAKSITLGIPMTFSISNYTINATYTYTVEKSIILDFKATDEYTLATTGSKLNKKYFMRTSLEGTRTVHSEYDRAAIPNQIVYTYKINRDGSAVRFRFISITMHLTSHDGKYQITTAGSSSMNIFDYEDTISFFPPTDLHKLVIVYPESLNNKLSFHEYSSLYNDNLFLFVYSRERVHTKWYQTGFFGFVLMVAVMVVITLTGQWEAIPGAIALTTTEATILTAIEVGVFSYGMSIAFPNMPMALRIAVTLAMTYAANGINTGTISPTTAPEAATPITISSITNSIENYFTNMSPLELTTFTANKMNMAYSMYMKDKLENYTEKAEKFIELASEATEKLNDKLKEFDVQDERTRIFASFMMDFIEAETYDQIAVSETYMSNVFDADMLTYISSTECQADVAKIPNLPIPDIMV